MAAARYLAMTASEFAAADLLPPGVAWMACHFSPYGTGLSNLPPSLPEGSLLILNDRIPFHGHDPQQITLQLIQAVETLGCEAVLLDFQQPRCAELDKLVQQLTSSLPCPTAVTHLYGQMTNCPLFLPPCPHHTSLAEHITPWNGRELWLDLAVDAETITLTKAGAEILPLPLGELPEGGHRDEKLHCHYSIINKEDSARFTLWRTQEDLAALEKESAELGITTLVGLYQELK